MTQETVLKTLWQKTKLCHNELEKSIVENRISFLQEVAIHYLKKKRRVFFKENRIVHWGEWDFGSLLIQGSEDVGMFLVITFRRFVSSQKLRSPLKKKAI